MRPTAVSGLPLPPNAMPSRMGLRALKAWRYVGVYGPELMLCVGVVRVGPARQTFWALWDRGSRQLHERTTIGTSRRVLLSTGAAAVRDERVQIELALEEVPGVETVSPTGRSYAWTRKQGGVLAQGSVAIDGRRRELSARAVIDDTAGYYQRHTRWRWSAGVGRTREGRDVAWNLVTGVHDHPHVSERTVWIDGSPYEVGPCAFDEDLRAVGALRFVPEAVRERRDNLVLVRSSYRQPFGTFTGELPGPGDGVELGERRGIRLTEGGDLHLAEGYGVMEEHDAWW